jgi:hypothetical protein
MCWEGATECREWVASAGVEDDMKSVDMRQRRGEQTHESGQSDNRPESAVYIDGNSRFVKLRGEQFLV